MNYLGKLSAGLALAGGLCGVAIAQGEKRAELRGNPGQFFGPGAYPREAIARREEGRVVARLVIDATGRVTDCTLLSSSGSAALDARTCEIALERVTFSPPTDEYGRALASTYTLPVRWVLPGATGLRPLVSLSLITRSTIAANMAVSECSASANGQAVEAPPTACERRKTLFDTAFARQATGRGLRVIRAIVEDRYEYAGASPPPAVARGATEIGRRITRFRIDATGAPIDCKTSSGHGDYHMSGGSPCDMGMRFDVRGRPAEGFPIEAAWTTIASYGKIK